MENGVFFTNLFGSTRTSAACPEASTASDPPHAGWSLSGGIVSEFFFLDFPVSRFLLDELEGPGIELKLQLSHSADACSGDFGSRPPGIEPVPTRMSTPASEAGGPVESNSASSNPNVRLQPHSATTSMPDTINNLQSHGINPRPVDTIRL